MDSCSSLEHAIGTICSGDCKYGCLRLLTILCNDLLRGMRIIHEQMSQLDLETSSQCFNIRNQLD